MYGNTNLYPLNLVGWQGSKVTEHVQCLVQPVPSVRLNLNAAQVGNTFCEEEIQMIC